MKVHALAFSMIILAFLAACSRPEPAAPDYDVIIRNGMIIDGSGSAPVHGDVAIQGKKIAAVGDLSRKTASEEIDANGLAISPGFINMLSWAVDTLIEDGRSQSDIRQGVTLEVFGEGWSMGPLSEEMKALALREQGDIKYPIDWTTLGEYLATITRKGISPNVASFVGATTIRIHVVGYEDRVPTPEELETMKGLVRDAMKEGALGVGSSLIYAPAFYAKTPELVELCRAAGEYGGMYITHMRSEGNRLLEAIDETIAIAKDAGVSAEIYHLKAAGQDNWPKMDAALAKIDEARAGGLRITADMYTYTAGATGLDAAMPPWVQEGGYNEWKKRLGDPAIRKRIVKEMRTPTDEWENLLLLAGSPDKVLLVAFKNDDLKPLTGRTLAEVAAMRGKSAEDTAMDLVIEDGSRVGAVYFLMSEENIRKQIAKPWVSFGSDEASLAPEGVFLKSNPHPRAYGNVARLFAKYVRDEKVISVEEAVRRLTSLPAENLGINDRGMLKPGYYADIVVFDPAKIQDHATFDEPHRYSTGVVDVFVNGTQVLDGGEHTGATPGMIVRGPGWGK